MDRLLRQQLDAIASDRLSGAAELALRAINALHAWLRRHRKASQAELLEIARALLRAQPSMAPFVRLTNELLLAMDRSVPPQTLLDTVARLSNLLPTVSDRIATRFLKSLRPGLRYSVATYSYSSTILKAITAARHRIPWILCSEGRPGQEGRQMASQIARLGIEVRFVTDAALPAYLPFCSLVLVGADAVASTNFLNKVGTRAIVARALEEKRPVCVLADTMKFCHRGAMTTRRWTWSAPSPKIWDHPPKEVRIVDLPFEWTPLERGVRILTERGWLTAAGVQRQVDRIHIAPRLRQWLLASVDTAGGAT